jgi:exo-poly-alpha-galacturonosidase
MNDPYQMNKFRRKFATQLILYLLFNLIPKKQYKMKNILLTVIIILFSSQMTFAAVLKAPENLKSPVGTETSSSIVLLWDKPDNYSDIKAYEIYNDGKYIGTSGITNFTVNNLKPGTTFLFTVKSKNISGDLSEPSNKIQIATKKQGKTYNILQYGAKGDSITLNTSAIQKAIDACSPGGTVIIPTGIFLSGALFLKSDMTLYIQKGGVLKGSTKIEDYYPIIPTRFEGWEVESFSSLITAGKLDKSGKINISNLALRGEGKIYGGGSELGRAMTSAKGRRSRGRLICLMNCSNVDIQGLSIENPPCWTIHYTYSQNVSIHDLKISSTASNGDGIDPDSSTDSYIFNCSFSTGDDCIAIKSGKNPEGNIVGKPTENVWITNCDFVRGHSVAIGSEMSGGVKNVLVRDCKLGNLYYGLQIKGSKERGGYVENITVKDCDLQQIKIVTSFNYNNDGDAAPDMPKFKNFQFTDLNMTKADIKMPVIYIEGFDDPEHYTRNIILRNIELPEDSKVYLKNCASILFENVLTASTKQKPSFDVTSSTKILY